MASRPRSLLRQVASLRADLEKNAKGEIPDFTRDLDFHRLASDLIAGCVDPAIMEETIGLWHLLGDRRGPGSRIAQETILNTLRFAPIHLQRDTAKRVPRNQTPGQLELNLDAGASANTPGRNEESGPPTKASKAATLLADEALRFVGSGPHARSRRTVNFRRDFWNILADLASLVDANTLETIRGTARARLAEERADGKEKAAAVSALAATFLEEGPDQASEELFTSLTIEAESEELLSAVLHAQVDLGLADPMTAFIMLEDFRDEEWSGDDGESE